MDNQHSIQFNVIFNTLKFRIIHSTQHLCMNVFINVFVYWYVVYFSLVCKYKFRFPYSIFHNILFFQCTCWLCMYLLCRGRDREKLIHFTLLEDSAWGNLSSFICILVFPSSTSSSHHPCRDINNDNYSHRTVISNSI